ncbi:hypothetical protein U1Q18_000234, partial [Sarracenia purpurea var. burkii]
MSRNQRYILKGEAMKSEKTLHGEEDEQDRRYILKGEVGGVIFEETEMISKVEESDKG